MANTLIMAGTPSDGLFIIAADRVGTEPGQPFLGCSLIVGPTGFPLSGPASAAREEILTVTIEPLKARAARRLNSYNDILQNKRIDQYRTTPATRERNTFRWT